MPPCFWCECSPCFLDCEARRQRGLEDRRARPEWRHRGRAGAHKDLHRSERTALLKRARAFLRRGADQAVVSEATGLSREYVSVIAYRLRRGITGGRRTSR